MSKETYYDVDKSVYEFQKEHTKDFKHNKAYRYYGRNISYNTSHKNIENIAKVMQAHDVKKGDIIPVIAPMLPSVVDSFYGINKVGATFFPIDPRNNATRIRDFLNLTGAKQVIMLDQAYGKIDAIIDHTNVQNVLVITPEEAMFPFLRLSYRLDQQTKTKKYYDAVKALGTESSEKVANIIENHKDIFEMSDEEYEQLYQANIFQKTKDIAMKNLYYQFPPIKGYEDLRSEIKKVAPEKEVESIYDKAIPASLTMTSGTTGKPKLVPTMNRSYNVKVRDYAKTTMPIEKKDRILSMPPFILYGEIFMHMAYVRGVQNVIIPDITAYYYPGVIKQEKIAHAVGVPSQALELANDRHSYGVAGQSEKWLRQMRHLKSVSTGGTKMLLEHEKKINKALKELGIEVTQGYSMTELTPASMTNMPGFSKEQSVGRPIGDTKCKIVDLETNEEKKVNEIGNLLVKSETQFTGYYKNEEATQKALIQYDGKQMVNTGDLAFVDEDGYYHIVGREKEMIIRPDGHNNFPSEMEELLAKHPIVADCAVVGYPYPGYDSPLGEYPKAHIVLKEEYKNEQAASEEMLKEYCLENLPERDVPYYYEFHDKLPLTPVLKVDKEALKASDKQQALEQKAKQKVKK